MNNSDFQRDKILKLHLPAWVIADGNYNDFWIGQIAHFAIEFTMISFARIEKQEPRIQALDDGSYAVRALTILSAPWVIDFGIKALSFLPRISREDPSPPAEIPIGEMFEGNISLSLDLMRCAESEVPSQVSALPPLIYRWQIQEIEMDAAPWVQSEEPDSSPGFMIRDASKPGKRKIEQTRAWTDDNGSAFYTLHCKLMDNPPVSVMPEA